MRCSCAASVKRIFRPTAMPVLKNFTTIRGVHGASGINTLKLPPCFSYLKNHGGTKDELRRHFARFKSDKCWSGNSWCISVRRNCFDWEIPRIALLLKDLEMVSLNDQVEDCIIWNGQEDGNFTVKACYKALNSGGNGPNS
ncbi:hypothetical protein HAX54_028778 [Datura stramonium]|uniref:Uncharacterized protein n=1 Tax=Datura stramonium TaxID=4076 RepID=A0ABS8S9W2_DATST|nr:hypothetical protein [Datura stramonium]